MHDRHEQRSQPQPEGPITGQPRHPPFNPAAGHTPQHEPFGVGAGRPMQAPLYSEPAAPAAPAGPSKALIGVMVAGVVVAASGMVYKVFHKPEPKPPVVRGPSVWEQQQSMMREALDMAREAQRMQRERQGDMQRAMEMEYGELSGVSDGDW